MSSDKPKFSGFSTNSNTPNVFGGLSSNGWGGDNSVGRAPPESPVSSNDPNAPKPGLFGSNTGGPSLFGGSKPSGPSGGFGGFKPAAATTPTSADKSTSDAAPAGSPLFGGPSITSPLSPGQGGTSSSFGAGAAKGTMFGGTSASASASAAKPNVGGFSFMNAGSSAAATPATTALTSNLFGGVAQAQSSTTPQPTTKQTPNLFSTTPAGAPPSTGGTLFGGASAGNTTGAASSNPFANVGQPKKDEPKPTSNLFGGNSAGATQPKPPGSGMFGAVGSGTAGDIAASTTAPAPAAGGFSFAKPSAPAAATAAPSTLFGGGASTGATTAAGAGANLFGAKKPDTPTASSGTSTSSLFANAAPAVPAKSPSLFGAQPASSAGSSTPAAAATSNLFGAKTTTTTPAPAAGLFSGLGNATATTAAKPTPGLFGSTTTSAPAAPGLFGPTNTATSAPATPSLFTNPAAPRTSAPAAGATAAAPLFGAVPTDINAAAPAAPFSGPTHVAQASRLAGKTIGDILTNWSTSLSTHQKTFASLSTAVGAWDRQLVGNSTAISSLYGRCFQAERDVGEVERVLLRVERGQGELENLLDILESGVDDMIVSAGLGQGGESQGGVDAERQRVYALAERSQERVTEMGHSLTEMIGEVNAASTKLSETNQAEGEGQGGEEDPLAQIVRVLNAHLVMLQGIDEGAASLQGRVERAQREVGVVGGEVQGGRGWVEGFGRSYLGRR